MAERVMVSNCGERHFLEAAVRFCWELSLSVVSEELASKQNDRSLVGSRVALPCSSQVSIAKN
jgi:hypothetical protein